MNEKLRKLVDVHKLVSALNQAGMAAGYSPCGESSYELYRFNDGTFIWAYVPDPNCDTSIVDELLISKKTLAEIRQEG